MTWLVNIDEMNINEQFSILFMGVLSQLYVEEIPSREIIFLREYKGRCVIRVAVPVYISGNE